MKRTNNKRAEGSEQKVDRMESVLKNTIKKTLRVFRLQLSIPLTSLKLDPEVFKYLKERKLIDFDSYNMAYVITPKGFSWDVDLGAVRLPAFDEDIMERDKNIV